MRILHTADWHLGKRLDDFPRLEEQREVMEEICEIAEQEAADVVLVAGDLFDTFNPPTEAVDLLYRTLKRLSAEGRRPVIAIAGNHDSPDRIEAADPLARECGILFAGYPHTEIPPYLLESGLRVLKSDKGFLELLLPGSSFPLRILFTPYANEYRLKTFLGLEESEKELRSILQERWQHLADSYCDQQGVNILLSHLFVVRRGDTLPEEPEEEKPILQVGGAQAIFTENIPSQIQYTALGHLHRMHFVEKGPSPVCYSGSPLSYSFAEAGQQKQLLMIDLEPGVAAVVRELPLTRSKMLLRKRAEGIDEALQWLSENRDALVELTIVTDSFLTAMERRALMAAHPGIVSIIPEVTDAEKLTESGQKQIDLTKGMEALFRDYFRHEKGQEPNDEIMQLFNEIVAEEE
jgi:exonuclease SbcD